MTTELTAREAPASYVVDVQAAIRKGYKQTEVGVIPEDWVCESLESMSAFITKGSTPTTYGYKWERSGILFLRSECVSEVGLDLAQSMFISAAAHASLRRSEVCDGDILITITGNVGRAVYLQHIGYANLNQHIARVRITSAQVERRYVYHYLSQASVRRYFNTITTGQAYPQISLKQVRKTAVPLPPTKAEQEAIAEALSDADALVEALEQLLAKRRQLKQGTVQELLTGKKRLPGFSGEWEVKRLGEMAIFFKGRGLSKSALIPFGGVPCIHYGELFTQYPETIRKVISHTNESKDSFRSSANDVLMPTSDVTPRGLAKASCITINGVILGGDILVIRSDRNKIFGPFLSYLIRY